MAQLDNLFTAIWHNTTTGPGTPLTGLSATITIREKPSNTIVINNVPMTEVGDGEYDYIFTNMDSTKAYSYVMNPNTTSAYVVTGFVDPRSAYLDKPLSNIVGAISTGRGSSQYDFNASDRKNIQDLLSLREFIDSKINDTKSHIDIAKGEINDKIESIEIPTTDLSDITKSIGVARQQLTKLSEFLRKESEKEKDELKKEYEGKIGELETTIDGIESMFEEFKGMSEEEKKKLLESKENELKEITEFAEEAIEYYKEMKDNAGEEIKSKIKSLL